MSLLFEFAGDEKEVLGNDGEFVENEEVVRLDMADG